MNTTPELKIAIVLFPRFTLLDVAGPLDVLARLPGASVSLVSPFDHFMETDTGFFLSSRSIDPIEKFDVIIVPGGPGQQEVMENRDFIGSVQALGKRADIIASVCTGSLILAAAGLLKGFRATTHWLCIDMLEVLGAHPVEQRIVIDRNRITAAGVSAGIDMALTLAMLLRGKNVAREIQLLLEYDPQPPFRCGSVKSASTHLINRVAALRKPLQQARREQVLRIAGGSFLN